MKPNIIRNILINKSKEFGLTQDQVKILKENGDIMKVMRERNSHLAPYGHGRILWNNQYWVLTPDQYSMLLFAISNQIPVKWYGEKWDNFIKNRPLHHPFSGLGMQELEYIVKFEECAWEQFLIQQGFNKPQKIEVVVPTDEDKMLFNVYKNYVLTFTTQEKHRHFTNAMDYFMRTDANCFNFASNMRAVCQFGDIHDDTKWATARDTISNSSAFQSFVKRFI